MSNIGFAVSEKLIVSNVTDPHENCTLDAITELCVISNDVDNVESALFALLFCVVFVLLLALLLLLICKVWSLRRSVVPSIYKIDQNTGAVVSVPNMTETV